MKYFLVLLLPLMLASCDRLHAPSATNEKEAALVTVSGTSISEKDLDDASRRLLNKATQEVDADTRKHLLDSLVSSRAIALQAEKQLDTETLSSVARKTAAYREELLMQEYIRTHGTVEPVTQEMIADYYAKNLQLFGEQKVKIFELLKAEPQEQNAKVFLRQQLEKLSQNPRWPEQAASLSAQGYMVSYHSGKAIPEMLDRNIADLVAKTPVGTSSELTESNGTLFLLRVTAEEEQAAKPISEVSSDIRKRLAPQQLKVTLKKLSDDALKAAKVQYSHE